MAFTKVSDAPRQSGNFGMGSLIVSLIEEARLKYPDDEDAQALHVRRGVMARRNRETSTALAREADR